MYSRKHLPGWVRPARPARWCALACRAAGGSSSAHVGFLLVMRGMYLPISKIRMKVQLFSLQCTNAHCEGRSHIRKGFQAMFTQQPVQIK